MALNSDNLIEKFATLLEEGEDLDPNTFAQSAIEIIAMLSVEPNLDETLGKINSKLQSIIQNAQTVALDALEMGTTAKFRAAKEIRDLKKTDYTSATMVH